MELSNCNQAIVTTPEMVSASRKMNHGKAVGHVRCGEMLKYIILSSEVENGMIDRFVPCCNKTTENARILAKKRDSYFSFTKEWVIDITACGTIELLGHCVNVIWLSA